MEQTRYLMWAKQKRDLLSNSSYGDSWEEQAFAEDAAGILGGCVWPPRSYSCNFCRREFRSAQALGGHMNVHRRDRARLKQSPNQQTNERITISHSHQLDHVVKPQAISFDIIQYPSQICNLLYNPNIPDPGVVSGVTTNSSPPIRVLTNQSFAKDVNNSYSDENISASHFLSEEKHKNNMVQKPPLTWFQGKNFGVLDSKNEEKKCKISREPNLNLAVCQAQEKESSDDDVDEEEIIMFNNNKRRRIGEKKKGLNFFPRFISPVVERCHPLQSEVLELRSTSSMEELDLELRLGDPPKVK